MKPFILKDADGKEYTLKHDKIVNPKTGEEITIATGKQPLLNPDGRQVEKPVYEYIVGVTPDEVINAPYPYLVFGSEFTEARPISLPTPYSNNLSYNNFIAAQNPFVKMAANAVQDPEFDAERFNNHIDSCNKLLIGRQYYKELLLAIEQNVLALYTNNLRMLLEMHLRDEKFRDLLCLIPTTNYHLPIDNYESYYTFGLVDNIFVENLGVLTEAEVYNEAEIFGFGMGLIGTINMNISGLYYEMINKLINNDAVNFYEIGKKKAPQEVPVDFLYSYGVDVVNETANMECGIISNMVEINVMNSIFRFIEAIKNLK